MNGKDCGERACYWDNGKPAQEIAAHDEKGNGYVVNFDRNGRKESEGAVGSNGNHGIWKSYFENGKLLSVEEWKDGVQHGRQVEYDDGGAIDCEGEYRNGEPYDGTFVMFDCHPLLPTESEMPRLERRLYKKGKFISSIPLDDSDAN